MRDGDMIVVYPLNFKWRKRWWDFEFAIDRFQVGLAEGKRIFS